MKIQKLTLFLLVGVMMACNSPKDAEKSSDTVVVENSTASKNMPNTNTQNLLHTIMGTGEGLLRGINFGDAIAEVKKKETLELFEEEPTHIGYTLDTPNLETIDILYEKDTQQKVSAIQVDIYMNTDASNDSLKTAMANLFTMKYGQPISQVNAMAWQIKPEGKVSIKTVKNKLDRGLEVRFTR